MKKLTKVCFDCKQELPIAQFASNGESSPGVPKVKPRCDSCHAAYEKRVFLGKLFHIVGGRDKLKCSCCGYNKYIGAIEFHHLDPSKKDRAISQMKNYSKLRLEKEINKCIMLCANCHRETHASTLMLQS